MKPLMHFAFSASLFLLALITVSASDCHDAELPPDGKSLFDAIYAKDVNKVRELIDLDRDLASVNAEGETALVVSIKLTTNHAEIPCLIASKRYINNQKSPDGKSPLEMAFDRGLMEVVFCLIQHGAEVNDKDFKGEEPLVYALRNKDMTLARLVAEHGAAKHRASIDGISPLLWALTNKELEFAKLLLAQGADPNFVGETGLDNGNSPLHEAVLLGDNEILQLLLKLGHNLNVLNFQKQTPLRIAYLKRKSIIANILIQNGANKDDFSFDWMAWNAKDFAMSEYNCKKLFEEEDSRFAEKFNKALQQKNKRKFRSSYKQVYRKIASYFHPDKCHQYECKEKALIIDRCNESFEEMITCKNFAGEIDACVQECRQPCEDAKTQCQSDANDSLPKCRKEAETLYSKCKQKNGEGFLALFSSCDKKKNENLQECNDLHSTELQTCDERHSKCTQTCR